VVVVVVGNAWRYDRFSTPVCGRVSTVVAVAAFAGVAFVGAVEVMRAAKATGIVHDVGSRARVASTRARPCPAPVRCCKPCNVARCGVANRRSGTNRRARQHPMRTAGRNPPALRFWVLRPPPFLCGLHVNCVGIEDDARRRRAHHQFEPSVHHVEHPVDDRIPVGEFAT
jgi:hypothetical protein